MISGTIDIFWGDDLDHHADSPNLESGDNMGVMRCLGQGGLRSLSALVYNGLHQLQARRMVLMLHKVVIADIRKKSRETSRFFSSHSNFPSHHLVPSNTT